LAEQPAGELRFRSARLEGVSFPKRIIELMVTPYEEEALVPWEGRMVTEIFSRGAYDGIERRPNRVRANRDHQVERTVGRALSFHNSEAGLAAQLRIAKTELGDETLALADDDCLDASAGYLPMKDGEQWETRSRVRIRKAWLGHIALVPEPAYESARVLAVRHAEREPAAAAATPNLDLVRAWRLEERYQTIGVDSH
jgi:HK97 family phage prohead protease